jgi:esterase
MEILNYKIFTPEDESNKEKIPLFILHGLLGSMDNWRSQAKRLSQSRPVITLDLRNHGDSPHIKGMSYREMYEDVIKVAQNEGIKSFHLLGHSMGGKVAMQLALAQPDMIESLIVVDIAPKPYPLWHQTMFQAVMSVPIDTITSRNEIDEYLKGAIEDRAERSFMLKNIKRNPNYDIEHKNENSIYSWKPNLKEISRGYLKIAGFTTALAQYPKKTLFIKGGNSPYIQDSDSTLIESLFPNSTIITIKESGHLPHIQQKDAFFDALILFLQSPPPFKAPYIV